MARIKDWLMGMQEEALHLRYLESVKNSENVNVNDSKTAKQAEPSHYFEFFNFEFYNDGYIAPVEKNNMTGNSGYDDIPF